MASSAPPPTEPSEPPSHATFESQWTMQSPAKVFGNLPPKPRAWERKPRQRQALSSVSTNAGKKARTIWKRNDFHAQSVQQHAELPKQPLLPNRPEVNHRVFQGDNVNLEETPTPDGKIVKRARLGLNGDFGRKKIGAAMWDRRRSALPHKIPKVDAPADHNALRNNHLSALPHELGTCGLFGEQMAETERSDTSATNEQDVAHASEDAFRLTPPGAAESAVDNNSEHHIPPPQGKHSEAEEKDVEHVHLGHSQELALVVAPTQVATTSPLKPNSGPHSPTEIQGAAARHLENMRQKLYSKTSRLSRRKTELNYSTFSTPPKAQQRRVSISADAFKTRATELIHEEPDLKSSARFEDGESSAAGPAFDAPILEPEEPQDFGAEGEKGDEIDHEVEAALEVLVESAVEAMRNGLTKDNAMADYTEMGIIEKFTVDGVLPSNEEHQLEIHNSSRHTSALEESSPDDATDAVPTVNFEHSLSDGQSQDDITPRKRLLGPVNEVIVEVTDTAADEGANVEANEALKSLESLDQPVPNTSESEQSMFEGNAAILQQLLDLGEEQQQVDEDDSVKLSAGGDQEAPSIITESSELTSTVKVSLNDEDTDILKDFLSRAKASKAAKIANQSSLLNRRDSDVVKHALASPRRALDDLDANSPSPRKGFDAQSIDETTVSIGRLKSDAASSPTPKSCKADGSDDLGETVELADAHPTTRRSRRAADSANSSAKRSLPSSSTPSTISVRRQDSSEPVVLKKSEAQELATLTRTNTRRNKGGAIPARAMLMKLKGVPVDEIAECDENSAVDGKVRWNEELVAYFEESKMDHVHQLVDDHDATSAASKPRARRAKMLGAMNGTPAKVRSRGLESPPLDENNIAELSAPSFVVPRTATDTKTNAQFQVESQQDDVQAPAAVAKQAAPKTATRTPRRIPTPAKPPKSELPVSEPMRTRHNSAPGQVRRQLVARENKELSDKLAANDKISGGGVIQTRSGTGVGTSAEAPRRSMVPRRGTKK